MDVLLDRAMALVSQNTQLVLIVAIVVVVILLGVVMLPQRGDPGTRKKASRRTMRQLEKAREEMKDTAGRDWEQ